MAGHRRTRTRTAEKPAAKPAAKARTRQRKTPKETSPLAAYQQALRRAQFGRGQLHLLLQARRLGKLLAIQQGIADEEFPPGACFLHVALPTVSSFCLRRIVEIDLDACTAILAIHGDDELEAGHVVVPLEGLGWIGFPEKSVPVGVRFAGFTLPAIGPYPRVLGPGKHLAD